MLAVATLVAALFGAPRPAHMAPANASCPTGPVTAFTTTARTCPALEISGRADGESLSLDPAFDVSVPPAQLARIVEAPALLAGYAADGRALFTQPVAANGPFHLYVPLAPSVQQAVVRLTLVLDGAHAERVASGADQPTAELISADDDHVIVAWNAHAFPAIRVADAPDRPRVGDGNGTSTYEQLSVTTRARTLDVDFSDGVRSVKRVYTIFGR